MKMKFKRKKTMRNIVTILLCGLLVFGVIFGAVALSSYFKDPTKKISPKFSQGSLDEAGEYVPGKASIYTKELFECKGLSIELDYESNVNYRVFFYDEEEKFVSSTALLGKTTDIEVPEEAIYARILIVPVWDSTVEVKDRVVRWYNIHKYSSQLEIRVLRDQNAKENLVDTLVLSEIGKMRKWDSAMAADLTDELNYKTTVEATDVDRVESIDIIVPENGQVSYVFYDADGKSLNNANKSISGTTEGTTVTVEGPANAVYVHFNFSYENNNDLTGYEIYLH